MRAFAHRSHSVKRRNAESRGEITIRCSAGGRFLEGETKFPCKRTSLSKKPRGAARALHGRPVDTAGDSKGTALVSWFKRSKPALDPRPIGNLRDPHVHLGKGIGRNHVCPGAAASNAHAYGQTALQLSPVAHDIDHAR